VRRDGCLSLRAVVPADLQEVIPVFLENRQKDFQSLTVAIAGDFEMIRQIGHRMKGSGNLYGFPIITALGAQIELCANVRDKAQVISGLAKWRHYLANVKTMYERLD